MQIILGWEMFLFVLFDPVFGKTACLDQKRTMPDKQLKKLVYTQ
jgi:hypothetical protein